MDYTVYFTKDYQKILKEKFHKGLEEVWKKDSKMVDYCTKSAAYIIPICGGKYLLDISKEKIKNEFWFGESDCGQGPSHNENNKIMENTRNNIEDYFLAENLDSINRTIEDLKDIIEKNRTYKKACHYIAYYSSPKDSPIHSWNFYDDWHNNTPNTEYEDLSNEDLEIILTAYKIYKEDFTKKLFTYLKKYGPSKLHIHSYWIDR